MKIRMTIDADIPDEVVETGLGDLNHYLNVHVNDEPVEAAWHYQDSTKTLRALLAAVLEATGTNMSDPSVETIEMLRKAS